MTTYKSFDNLIANKMDIFTIIYDEAHKINPALKLDCHHLLFTATPNDKLKDFPLYINIKLG